MFGGPFFESRDKILLLGKALKFGVIFQKLALKLFKLCKIMETMQNFHENVRFFARAEGKYKNYYIPWR